MYDVKIISYYYDFIGNKTPIFSYSTTAQEMPIFIIFRLLFSEIKNFVVQAPLRISIPGFFFACVSKFFHFQTLLHTHLCTQ